MPFNDLTGDNTSKENYFTFDNEGLQLDENDPRFAKGLYKINDPDYFFGMSMNVDFSQPGNGLVKGNNMTFEFNGDDDMWVYVDGVLMLDVGGIHDPRAGWIDFTTGVIWQEDGGYTTIRDRFEQAGYSGSDIVDKFELATDAYGHQYYLHPNGTVDTSYGGDGVVLTRFKDYSAHHLDMYYLERGAGASNLDIRFNLNTTNEDNLEIAKKINNRNYQKPYGNQTFKMKTYMALVDADKEPKPEDFKLLTGNGADADNTMHLTFGETKIAIKARYKGTPDLVKFGDDGVFDLKADNSMLLDTKWTNDPDNPKVLWYYVEEDGIEDYNVPSANGKSMIKIDGGNNYKSDAYDIENTPVMEVNNNPKKLGELHITKVVDYPSGIKPGVKPETFEFQVFLEDAKTGELTPYYVGAYYIVDEDGNYYKYENQELTKLDGKAIANYSSANGKIDGIPEGYTVIIEGLLPGTEYKVVETSAGGDDSYYVWSKYVRDGKDAEEAKSAEDGVEGKIPSPDEEKPDKELISDVDVHNKPKTADVRIIKTMDVLLDQEDLVTTSVVFELTGKNENGDPEYHEFVTVQFDKSDVKDGKITKELSAGTIPLDLASIEVKEVYASNYTPDPDTSVILTPEEVLEDEKTGANYYEAKFKNTYNDTITYNGGVVNKYKLDGDTYKYKESEGKAEIEQ